MVEAYRVLRDARKRAEYDAGRERSAGQDEAPRGFGENMSESFRENLYGKHGYPGAGQEPAQRSGGGERVAMAFLGFMGLGVILSSRVDEGKLMDPDPHPSRLPSQSVPNASRQLERSRGAANKEKAAHVQPTPATSSSSAAAPTARALAFAKHASRDGPEPHFPPHPAQHEARTMSKPLMSAARPTKGSHSLLGPRAWSWSRQRRSRLEQNRTRWGLRGAKNWQGA